MKEIYLNQEVIRNTINEIKQLCLNIQSLHPIETMKRAYWEFIFNHIHIEVESNIGTNQVQSRFLMEYLQSIFISIDLKNDLASPTEEEWRKIKKQVSEIYDNCRIGCLINKHNDGQLYVDKSVDRLTLEILNSWIQIRGDRYIIHEFEHLNKLLEPHNEELKKVYSVSVQDIVNGFRSVFLKICYSPKFLKDNYDQYKDLKLSKEEKLRLVFNNDIFDVEKITKWPRCFIKKLSATIGSQKSFLKEGKYPGTPLQLLPIKKKPFLEYNSKFYLFDLYIFKDHFYRNIQFSLLEDSSDYSDKWNINQNIVSERLPFEILHEIIGHHKKIRNFHYKITNYASSQSWFECDGLILFEDWLIVIEVKAGKTSYQAPAQNIDSHVQSINKLLVEPAKQGARFVRCLKEKKTINLYDNKNGNIIDKISIDSFKETIVLAVSLEQLTDFTPQIQHFNLLDLNKQGADILCISIDDLRVYRDVFNGVIEFFHFLKERKKALYNKKLELNDELDHLGLYIEREFNQYHDITESEKFKKSDTIIWHGLRDSIDRYLQLLFFDHKNTEKPKRYMPFFLKSIINDLEKNRKPGFVELGVIIYSLSCDAKKKINQYLLKVISLQNSDKRVRSACFLWGTYQSDLSVSCIIRTPGIDIGFRPIDYVVKNMLIQEKEEALLLDISVNETTKVTDVSFKWVRKSNLNDTEMIKYKKEVAELVNFRFYNVMKQRNGKKIGRNEKCPCGSGKKYKKCHLNNIQRITQRFKTNTKNNYLETL